jgi:hypothetical protein
MAAEAVHKGLAVRAAAKDFKCIHNRSETFLIIKSGNEQFFYSNKCTVWTVFSTEEVDKLVEYITTASHIHCGLTREKVMKPFNSLQKN